MRRINTPTTVVHFEQQYAIFPEQQAVQVSILTRCIGGHQGRYRFLRTWHIESTDVQSVAEILRRGTDIGRRQISQLFLRLVVLFFRI